jgi:glycosyltransferase involved in cell wall biosynthesis
VAVSEDYKRRIQHELGLLSEELTVLPACVELSSIMPREDAEQLIAKRLPGYQADLPLVTYMGRQDPEKGIDLLLYAAKMLQEKGERFQLAVCGTTAWGSSYRDACRRISFHLRVPVLEADYLSDEERTALYRASHCIVYPSIHREPFGMVPVEAMAQSTPVIVPDTGGIADLPFAGECRAGLRFRSWDTVDLAAQLERMLNDESLYQSLSRNARQIAEQYSAERVANGLLELLQIDLEAPKAPLDSDEDSQSAAGRTLEPAETQGTVVA